MDAGITGNNGDLYLDTSLGNVYQNVVGVWGTTPIETLKGDTGATGPQGPQGDKGDAGAPGKDGASGPAGTNGTNGTNAVWSTGANDPTSTTAGNPGDLYLNTTSGEVWQDVGGTWADTDSSLKGPQGAQGAQGAAGASYTSDSNWPALKILASLEPSLLLDDQFVADNEGLVRYLQGYIPNVVTPELTSLAPLEGSANWIINNSYWCSSLVVEMSMAGARGGAYSLRLCGQANGAGGVSCTSGCSVPGRAPNRGVWASGSGRSARASGSRSRSRPWRYLKPCRCARGWERCRRA